jgi:putative RNA 2'-phosphotransferase
MKAKKKIKVSKFLSLILRHHPGAGGITLTKEGWASTADVLKSLQKNFEGVTRSVLREIVAEDDKRRFAFGKHGDLIRANQGHSIDVDLGLIPVDPPDILFHGTARSTIWLIQRDGIRPMQRQYVHLSPDPETAEKVGKRHGDPYVIMVKAAEMADDGMSFYRSENGVWLTDWVPVEYLCFETMEDLEMVVQPGTG